MFTLLLVFETAIFSIFLIASSALTTALGLSIAHDGVTRKLTCSTVALFCESAGIVMSMFSFVFLETDPIHAHHAIVCGALLVALSALISTKRDAKPLDSFLQNLQLGQYCGVVACLAILTFVRIIEFVIG